MNASELKFVLRLLKYQDYRAPFSKIDLNEKIRICKELTERGLVRYSRKIGQFKIEPAGKGMLKQDMTGLPLTEHQRAILKACEAKSIVPSEIPGKKFSAEERQNTIQDLETRGLIKVEKFQITEVWLTDQGIEFLRDEFHPTGSATISLNLLGNYLLFLRQLERRTTSAAALPNPLDVDRPTDADILQMIRDLDRAAGTDNYLPIFHLRRKLEAVLSRDELDQVLYRLQRQDQLEISALVESVHYTLEEIQAGIPQDCGGPLFFLVVNEAS
ncbi:hypothetical protein BST81_07015 [Leptolyngbya sp. 'hensonii']|uniref:hypothetical protein n=1 Tax=Leptolyngbya sp. 'hensonii' TaxID=1922337 RepID=UPI00095028D9|nr:hypothetical protein [Leptolyngbya sp. 'hensonii']OLP18976.1 hypothetical protein BST81_07015 [Leptolyngbya sp. 'hensonii']